MADEPTPGSKKNNDELEELIGRADGLRQERRELLEQVAGKKKHLVTLEQQLVRAEQQARIRVGKPSRVLVLLALLGIAGIAGYEMLPTTVDLRFNSWKPGPAKEVEGLLDPPAARPVSIF